MRDFRLHFFADEGSQGADCLEVFLGEVRSYQRKFESSFNKHQYLYKTERIDPQLGEGLVRRIAEGSWFVMEEIP